MLICHHNNRALWSQHGPHHPPAGEATGRRPSRAGSVVRKTPFVRLFHIKAINLPRQARDKHTGRNCRGKRFFVQVARLRPPSRRLDWPRDQRLRGRLAADSRQVQQQLAQGRQRGRARLQQGDGAKRHRKPGCSSTFMSVCPKPCLGKSLPFIGLVSFN